MRRLAVLVGLCGVAGCFDFTDASGKEGYCFDWSVERYVLCDAGVELDAEVDAGELVDAAADASAPDAMTLDLGVPDSGEHPDAEPLDSGVHPDAEPADVGFPDAEPLDMGFADSGEHPDAEPLDSGVHPDAEPVDVGFPDSGAVQMVTITIQIAGNGRGNVASLPGLQIDCDYDGVQTSGVCSASFAITDVITLQASADRFYAFNGWTNACASSGNRFCQLDFSLGNQIITAFFN